MLPLIHESSTTLLFGAGAAPFFYGSGPGSEQTVSAAPAPTKMCRLRRLRFRLCIPGLQYFLLRFTCTNATADVARAATIQLN